MDCHALQRFDTHAGVDRRKVLISCGVARAVDNGAGAGARAPGKREAPGSGDFPQSPGLQWVDSRSAKSFRYGADAPTEGGSGRGIGGGLGGVGGTGGVGGDAGAH